MNRALAILAAGLVSTVAACGDSNHEDKVTVTLFQAAPDTIETGQATKLLFAIEPADASVTIDGLGDQTGKTQLSVTPGQTTTYHLTATKGRATTTADAKVTVNKKPVTITLFQAAPDAIETGQATKLLFAVDPADAKLDIAGIGDVTGKTQIAVSPTATTTYKLTATKNGVSATSNATVTVGPQTATGIKLEASSATPTAGSALTITVTAIAGSGAPAPGFRGTVHLTSSDARAVLPADLVFVAADAGQKQVPVTLKTAGPATVTGTDTGNAARQGTAAVTVGPGAATTFALAALPAAASAGQPLALSITALDEFANVATTYAGQARVTSDDAKAILPATGAFTAGVRAVSLAFGAVGDHTATVSEVAGAIAAVTSTTVAVGPGAPRRIAIAAAHPTAIAGAAESFTATLFDAFDNLATSYAGTIHFTASDPSAALPADFTFSPADAGAHAFAATLKTAGTQAVALSDPAAGLTGSVAWSVGPAAATSCAITQAPPSAIAGAALGVTVVFRDPFANQATGFAGTVALTASDLRAVLPGAVTYVPLVDAGSHAFSASLLSTGLQTLTATDTASATQCAAIITVTPAAPRLVVALPGNANAGYAVAVGLTVRDLFDNPIPSFTGTVSFSSTDHGTGAATPAPIVFTGSEGGVASASATFVTLGAQQLSATSDGTPVATGAASSTVHGLVYSAPTTGRVRLVANPASTTQVVQLDLVASVRLEVASFFGGGPGPFAAGMNLPLDTTRVGEDATLFLPGPALTAGTGTRAAAAKLGATDHVLYAAVSRKRVTGTNFNQENDVAVGGVFFSVRLKLQPDGTVGPVFDGAQPSPLYRAAIRDQFGDDVVNQGDIGVGKLEVR